MLLGARSHKRIGRLGPSISTPLLSNRERQSLRVPLRSRSHPTAPPPYEEPPPPIPISRPDEPPVIDDPPPRRNLEEFRGAITTRLLGNRPCLLFVLIWPV
jgi:hypothetical protein